MYPNGNLFEPKLDVTRSGVERADKRGDRKNILLGWIKNSREDQSRGE